MIDLAAQFAIKVSNPWMAPVAMTIELQPGPPGDFGSARVGGLAALPIGPGQFCVEVTQAVEFRPADPRHVTLEVVV